MSHLQVEALGVFPAGQHNTCVEPTLSFSHHCCASALIMVEGHLELPQSTRRQTTTLSVLLDLYLPDQTHLVPDTDSQSSVGISRTPFLSLKMPSLPPSKAFRASWFFVSKSTDQIIRPRRLVSKLNSSSNRGLWSVWDEPFLLCVFNFHLNSLLVVVRDPSEN